MSEMFKQELAEVIRNAISETSMAFFHGDFVIKDGPAAIEASGEAYVPPSVDITAIVGFSGEIQGGVHFSAPVHAALGLASAFCGESVDELGSDAMDAMGELANIVAGSVKSHFSEEINLTPPSVITGAGHNVLLTSHFFVSREDFSSSS